MATDLGCPPVVGLTGSQLWRADSESAPPPGERCWCCGAIRDKSGLIVSGGILPGDRLGCAACTCLQPYLERTAYRREKPSLELPKKGRPESEMTLKKRRDRLKTSRGRVWQAMWDAETTGDDEMAARLQSLLYRHEYGEIDDAEMDRRLESLTRSESLSA